MLRPAPRTAKRLRVLFAAVLVLALLFSVLFLAVEAHHDCDGEGCAICAQLAVCEGFLQRLSLVFCMLSAAGLLVRIALSAVSALPAFWGSRTLIALKVKLSD